MTPSVSYEVRTCDARDMDAAVHLYRDTFRDVDGVADIGETTRRFVEKMRARKVLVAIDATSNLVGFAAYDLVGNVPPSLVDGRHLAQILNDELRYARDRNTYPELRAYLEERKEAIGKGSVVVQYFDNDFTTGASLATAEDVYCTYTAVTERLRGNGVAPAMIGRIEELAREMNAPTFYLHCWTGGCSPRVFQRAGFEPIIEMGPEYEDGTSSLLLGKRLQ